MGSDFFPGDISLRDWPARALHVARQTCRSYHDWLAHLTQTALLFVVFKLGIGDE